MNYKNWALIVVCFGIGYFFSQLSHVLWVSLGLIPEVSIQKTILQSEKSKQVYEYLEQYYYGFWTKKQEEVEDAFLSALTTSIGDKYTQYFNTKDAKTFTSTLHGDFEWIGAVIGEHPKWIQVLKVLKNSPAEKAWIEKGDIFLSVDQKTLVWMTAEDAVDLIRGKKGTSVKITTLRIKNEKQEEISITRDTVIIETVESHILTGTSIGYIWVNIFWENTTDDFIDHINQLTASGVTGLILDLRWNAWGFLESSVDIASLFLPERSLIVETRWTKSEENKIYYSRTVANRIQLPIIMIVNSMSASATEILAWALQDHNRAIILWEKTYGKWSVQIPIPLTDGSLIKITVAKWYTPNNHSIDEKWIHPDIEVILQDEDYKKLYDRQLESAKKLIQDMIDKKISVPDARKIQSSSI